MPRRAGSHPAGLLRLNGRAARDDVEIDKRFHITTRLRRVLVSSAGSRCKIASSMRCTTLPASMKPKGERYSLPSAGG
jgi:hypothetical protein